MDILGAGVRKLKIKEEKIEDIIIAIFSTLFDGYINNGCRVGVVMTMMLVVHHTMLLCSMQQVVIILLQALPLPCYNLKVMYAPYQKHLARSCMDLPEIKQYKLDLE